jgi:hypothetical protein
MKKQEKRHPKRESARESAREPRAPKDGSVRRGPRSSVVSPRDEKGVPYRGDFPNPLRGTYRDCF